MLELEKHIKDLLVLHDCVILPQLGGFVVNTVSANYNERTGVFTPPARKIVFNHLLSYNDGLLISHIAQRLSLNYEEAQGNVQLIVNDWLDKLRNHETIQLSDLGSLKLNQEGQVMFNDQSEYNISADMFGLSTFHFSSIDDVAQIESPNKHLVRRTVSSKSVRQIAASVTILVSLLLISPEIKNSSNQAAFSTFQATNTEVVNESSPSKAVETIEVTAPETTPTVIEEEIPDTKEVTTPDNKYFLIAGSFKTQAQAQQFIKKLNRKNITTAEILPVNNGRIRVSMEGFTEKQEALNAMQNYRSKNGFSSVWVYTKN